MSTWYGWHGSFTTVPNQLQLASHTSRKTSMKRRWSRGPTLASNTNKFQRHQTVLVLARVEYATPRERAMVIADATAQKAGCSCKVRAVSVTQKPITWSTIHKRSTEHYILYNQLACTDDSTPHK